MSDVGKFKAFMDGVMDVGSGIGKFYSENADAINDTVRTAAAIHAMNKDPNSTAAAAMMANSGRGGGGSGSGSGSGSGIGAAGFFPKGSTVETDEMSEGRPKGDNGVYKFKITGFSSSPFIKLKR